MFTVKPKDEMTGLDEAIDRMLNAMAKQPCDSPEYAKMLEQLSKLYSLKEIDPPRRVSPDTLALVIGNLAGIVMIVGHERAHVVTSKAIQFILKLR